MEQKNLTELNENYILQLNALNKEILMTEQKLNELRNKRIEMLNNIMGQYGLAAEMVNE